MNINVYNHEMFGSIRKIVMDDGVLWLVAIDIAKALGYRNIRDAISTFVNPLDKNSILIDSPAGPRKTTVINMKAVYDLCLHSRLPKAQEFQYWVTHEVVPEIQQYGMYIGDNAEFANVEYDKYGRIKVIEVDEDGLMRNVNKYRNEVVETRNKMAEMKERYEKKLKEMQVEVILSRNHSILTSDFSNDVIGSNVNTQNILNLEYPIAIMVKNIIEACEYLGFKRNYGEFLTWLSRGARILYYFEDPDTGRQYVSPTHEAITDGIVQELEYDPSIKAKWYIFTDSGLEALKHFLEVHGNSFPYDPLFRYYKTGLSGDIDYSVYHK